MASARTQLDELAGLEQAAALVRLHATASGLSGAEAADRLARTGANELASARRTLPRVVLAQLRSPLLGLLVVAAAVSIGVGEHTDGAIIIGIIISSVGLGVFNEYRSEQTLAALRERTGRRATALRDGKSAEIAASALVPGDVCILQTGDVVPADLRLLDSSELTVDEATLTGEAYPAEKGLAPSTAPAGATIRTAPTREPWWKAVAVSASSLRPARKRGSAASPRA